MVSEREVVHALAKSPATALADSVADVMPSQLITCRPDDRLADLWQS